MCTATSSGPTGAARSRRTRILPLPADLFRAYAETIYSAGGISVRLGRRSASADALLASLGAHTAGFVSAWNPMSRRMPEGWNRRMHRALARSVRGLPSVPGLGIGRGWSEEHLLIAADPRHLAVLARRFRQRAIVLVQRGRPAKLVVTARPDDPRPAQSPTARSFGASISDA